MKLFVLALLALSCVQLVIAGGWDDHDDTAEDHLDISRSLMNVKTPFQTLEHVIKTPQRPEDIPFDPDRVIVEPTGFGRRDPFRHLFPAIPPTYLSRKNRPIYGELKEVPNHPELVIFYETGKSPWDIDEIPIVYFRVRFPNKPVPFGRTGLLTKSYTLEAGGEETMIFRPLLDAQPPGSKKGSGGSKSKKNQPERLLSKDLFRLKAAVPPLPGLEAQGDGRDGDLKAFSDGVFLFEPKRLPQGIPNRYFTPVFYLRTYFPQFSDGKSRHGRLLRYGEETFWFETFHTLDDDMKQVPQRNPPGKKRRTNGNEAMMRSLPNTYWNSASRFL